MKREYRVRRLMLGATPMFDELDAPRVLRVRRARQADRGPERELRSLRRWGERQWRRLFAEHWIRVGDLEITYGEPGDLWIRNMGAYRVDQRAIERDALTEAWSGGLEPLSISAHSIEIGSDEPRGINALRSELQDVYPTLDEQDAWLDAPHPLLGGDAAGDLIGTDREAEVWALVDQLRSGAVV